MMKKKIFPGFQKNLTGVLPQEYISGGPHLHKSLTDLFWNKLVIVLYLYTLKTK
jgi:hypothetical protein